MCNILCTHHILSEEYYTTDWTIPRALSIEDNVQTPKIPSWQHQHFLHMWREEGATRPAASKQHASRAKLLLAEKWGSPSMANCQCCTKKGLHLYAVGPGGTLTAKVTLNTRLYYNAIQISIKKSYPDQSGPVWTLQQTQCSYSHVRSTAHQGQYFLPWAISQTWDKKMENEGAPRNQA